MRNKQLPLPLKPKSETRAERIERLLGEVPKVKRASRMFDAAACAEATEAARHA